MAHYRKIDTRIWNDEKFRGLSDDGKLAFFFLLTHPNMTSIGAMRATIPGLGAEMGWTAKGFGEAFGEALAKGMAKHDEKACVVWLPNFIRYNPPESPNVLKAWGAAIEMLPECGLTTEAIHAVKGFAEGLTEGFTKVLPEAFAKAMPNQEQKQEQELYTPPAAPARERVSPEDLAGFRRFWSAYPSRRRLDRGGCAKTWAKKNLEPVAEQIVLHVEAMKLTPDWMKDDGQFVPNALTYLNQRRFEDGFPEAPERRLVI